MKKILNLIIPFTLIIVMHSCVQGFSSDREVKGSCHYQEPQNEGYCLEYTGDDYTPDSVQSGCDGQGTFSVDLCGTRNDGRAIGECIVNMGAANEYVVVIDSDGTTYTTEADQENYCVNTLTGEWFLL